MLPIWAFIAVTVPLVLTPGASTAIVLRNSIAGGTRAGLLTAVGINAGSLCYGLLTAFGFSLLVREWPSLWSALRAAGAAYLAWLGVQSWRHAWRRHPASVPRVGRGDGRTGGREIYEGFLTNALNPSIAAFYLLVVPQFIPRDAPRVLQPSREYLGSIDVSRDARQPCGLCSVCGPGDTTKDEVSWRLNTYGVGVRSLRTAESGRTPFVDIDKLHRNELLREQRPSSGVTSS